MRVHNEIIKRELRDCDLFKYDERLLIRVEFRPNYFYEFIKKTCEDRWYDSDYFKPEEAERLENLFFAFRDIAGEYDVGVPIHGSSCGVVYDADFRRLRRYDDNYSKMLMIAEKPVSFNPFFKYCKRNDEPKRIIVGKKRCRTYDEALGAIREWMADYKEKSDEYQDIEQG